VQQTIESSLYEYVNKISLLNLQLEMTAVSGWARSRLQEVDDCLFILVQRTLQHTYCKQRLNYARNTSQTTCTLMPTCHHAAAAKLAYDARKLRRDTKHQQSHRHYGQRPQRDHPSHHNNNLLNCSDGAGVRGIVSYAVAAVTAELADI